MTTFRYIAGLDERQIDSVDDLDILRGLIDPADEMDEHDWAAFWRSRLYLT